MAATIRKTPWARQDTQTGLRLRLYGGLPLARMPEHCTG
ncbi:hypothetical protein DWUX_509 [Desulfovibrio diazotrophicus]|nr:hypothetical protein DWUX_509 [Desulfovibrio diazotrophicus]VVU42805.1 hypothetical protein DWUX_151 [Desulfovibrio diazotrophicus]